MINFKQRIEEKQLHALFATGTFGIEKEGQRVNENGQIVQTMHPNVFGNRSHHPYIQTDFAETQLELITPAVTSEKEAIDWLHAIHEVVFKQLPDNEWMSALSMPSQLPDEANILEAQMSEADTQYRHYLSQKYGKYKQMVSGIHFNFGFTKDFLTQLCHAEESLVTLQNEVYLKVARQFMRYQWLLVYLFGSSIAVDNKYFKDNECVNDKVRSIRASEYGYVNEPHIQVSYDSMARYVETLQQYVQSKQLIAEKEYYSSVRFRGASSAQLLLERGIQYVELRLFDINPFLPVGIDEKTARFIHLFVMLMLWLDEVDSRQSVEMGKQMAQQTALEHPLSRSAYEQEGMWLLQRMQQMIVACQLNKEDEQLVMSYMEQLQHPHLTVGGQLTQQYDQNGHIQTDCLLTQQHKQTLLQRPYGIQSFAHMELSTQALIEDAIIAGITVEVLDANDQFLKLTYKDHVEYVKNGNMTRLDTYVSPLIMANKVVTKKVLEQANFNVPKSVQVTTVQQALQQFSLVHNKPIVIKPKSTNFGLGITIFKDGVSQRDDFEKAVTLALQEDNEVMIEDYIAGTEYRFFVLGNETKAVLLRVGANVVGDGVSTIEQLVAKKNSHALRGDGSTTPLKKIVIGDIETLQLNEQGYTKDSIVPKDTVVYLRENSNISTGGDSIDMTDAVHPSYKAIAVGIAQAMFANVCGVDLIIKDITKPATDTNAYGVIEANFNPMMMMHIYPAVGQSRRLTKDILHWLFPLLEGTTTQQQ